MGEPSTTLFVLGDKAVASMAQCTLQCLASVCRCIPVGGAVSAVGHLASRQWEVGLCARRSQERR